MSISLRIKELRKQKKLSQAVFSAQIGVSQASVSHYENGDRIPDTSFMNKVCATYNVNLNWIITGEGDMYNNVRAREGISSKLISIAVVAPIAAGLPLEVLDDAKPLEVLQLPASILSLPPPYYAFKVEGESMAPYIQDGDIVVLSRDWRGLKLHDRICGFRTPDGITLKKLFLQPKHKTAWLMPLNHSYAPTPYNKDTEDLFLFGVLVLSIRKYA